MDHTADSPTAHEEWSRPDAGPIPCPPDKGLMAALSIGRDLAGFAGSRVMTTVAFTVPVGVAIGFLEFLLGASLYLFLNSTGLIPPGEEARFAQYFSWANPTALLVSIAGFILVFRFLAQFLPAAATEWFMLRLRETIAVRVLSGYRENFLLSVSDVTNILGNLGPRAGGLVVGSSQLITSTLTLVTILASLILLSWQLTLVTFGLGLVFGIPGILLRRRSEKFHEFVATYTTAFTEIVTKDIRNVHFLRVSGANEVELARLVDLTKRIIQNFLKWEVRFAAKVNLPAFASVVIGICIVSANAQFKFAETGELVPFVYLLSRTAGAVAVFLSALASTEYALPFARGLLRYREQLFEEPPSTKEAGLRSCSDIEEIVATDLVVGRGSPLGAPLSFTVRRGQTLLIQGESGRGKTTTLMTLVGVIRALDGGVFWNGIPVDHIDPTELRGKIGYAAPDPYLFDGTIRENLVFGLTSNRPSDKEIEDALWCACAEFVHDFPDGLDHRLTENGEGISAGQRQRLSLARSFLRKPQVLLFDEAMANIDEGTEKVIMERIFAIYSDIIVIAVSHRTSMRQFAAECITFN